MSTTIRYGARKARANIGRVATLTTINSPMRGLDSAALSVAHGHFVIPSWRDLATDSRFIAD